MAKQTYLYTITDQKINEIAKNIIDDLYRNDLIVKYVHNGKPIPNFHEKLINRRIPSTKTPINTGIDRGGTGTVAGTPAGVIIGTCISVDES